jgi:hypothetical protein
MAEEKINVIINEAISVKSGDVLIIHLTLPLSQFENVAAQLKEHFGEQGITDLVIIGVPSSYDSLSVFERLDKEAMRERGWVRIAEA